MKTHGFQGSHSKWANYTLKSQFSGLRCAFLNPQSLPIAAPDCPDWFNSSILLNDIGQHHHNSSWALKKWGDPKKSSDKKKCHHSFFTQKISHTHTHLLTTLTFNTLGSPDHRKTPLKKLSPLPLAWSMGAMPAMRSSNEFTPQRGTGMNMWFYN